MRLPGIIIASLLFLALLLPSQSFTADSERSITVKQIIGSVKIRRGTSTVWNDARPKIPLKQTDAIRTFIESEAELETSEGSVIKVGENTTIEIGTLYGDAEKQKTSVKILNGAVLANVKKLVSTTSTFDFETPTATAAIRGTVVGFEVSKDQTTVKVYEGRVWVIPQGSKKGMEIQPNQMGIVKKGVDAITVGKIEGKSPITLSVPGDSTVTKDSSSKVNIPVKDSAVLDTSKKIPSSESTDTTAELLKSKVVPKMTTLQFFLSTPTEGMEVKKTLVQVAGTVSSGAEVTGMSIRMAVTAAGQFSGQIPIANEPGDYFLEFEAALDGVSKKITRKIKYTPEYRFVLSSPTDRQIVTSTMLPIKGEIAPAKSEISVFGRRLSVNESGQFSGVVTIPDEEGEVLMEFEVATPGLSRTENRRIIYKRPPDTNRPQVSASIAKGCWSVTVFDRTPDEEITLIYTIDNVEESKTMRPNESTCIPFEEGVHSYQVYAKDKSNNISSTEVLKGYGYLATTTWLVKMRKPTGNSIIDLPPASPANESAVYPVEFTIENLPDDNMNLIREVVIINKANGKKSTIRMFTDNFIEADIELVRNKVNQLQIDVNDINNITKSTTFQITVK